MNFRILNWESFNGSVLAREIYTPENRGVVVLRNFLLEEFRQEVLEELEKNSDLLEDVGPVYNKVEQNFKQVYFERDEIEGFGVRFPKLELLRQEVNQVTDKIGIGCGHYFKPVNSVGIHLYDQIGKVGIGLHRDFVDNRNLTSLFVIEGNTPFSTYSDKDKNDPIEFEVNPGDMVAMRCARNEDEINMRPIHSVEVVNQRRYSVGFRRIRD